MAGGRFQDPGRLADHFWTTLVLVECPRCGACARLAADTRELWMHVPRRLACVSCGRIEDHDGGTFRLAQGVDPCFGHPLWLRTPCAGELLWAWNPEHLAFLRDFVGASLRERLPLQPDPHTARTYARNSLLTSRLPRWMKLAKHRDDVLQGLARLEARARVAGPPT